VQHEREALGGAEGASTTSNARPTEFARSVSCSGSMIWSLWADGAYGEDIAASSESSRRDRRCCSMFKQTRATTVVSHAPRFSMLSTSERLSRSHASWRASSASLIDPTIR
jgi:hypothetical protein